MFLEQNRFALSAFSENFPILLFFLLSLHFNISEVQQINVTMYIQARQASGCLNGKERPLSIAAIDTTGSPTILQSLS